MESLPNDVLLILFAKIGVISREVCSDWNRVHMEATPPPYTVQAFCSSFFMSPSHLAYLSADRKPFWYAAYPGNNYAFETRSGDWVKHSSRGLCCAMTKKGMLCRKKASRTVSLCAHHTLRVPGLSSSVARHRQVAPRNAGTR